MSKAIRNFLNSNDIPLDDKFATLYNYQCSNASQVYGLLEHAHLHVFFDTTYSCDLACGHCIYAANANTPLTFIPVENVLAHIHQAKTELEHICSFSLFGGEPTLAEIHNNGYFKTIADTVHETSGRLRMSTNGNWVNGKNADYLTEQIVYMYNAVPHFQLQLSVDRFHKNCVESAIKVIQQLDKYQELKSRPIVIRGFDFDKNLAKQFESLKTDNINIRTFFDFELIPSGRAAELAQTKNQSRDAQRAIILGDSDISGNVALSALRPCSLCNRFQIELHFTPDGKVFTFDQLDYAKHITDAVNPDGSHKTYKQIKHDLSELIFVRYQNQIRK